MERVLLLEESADQIRAAVLEDGKLCELYAESENHETSLTGNIYAGRVQNIMKGMNAAFIDIGIGKNAFLSADDIPVSFPEDAAPGRKIENLLHEGMILPVQIVKEPGGSKGPRVSGNITLTGRLCVLFPMLKYSGVSKKIEDIDDRNRLYLLASELSEKTDYGVIMRTESLLADDEEITREYFDLIEEWKKVSERAKHAIKPVLVGKRDDLIQRVLKKYISKDILSIKTDNRRIFNRLEDYMRMYDPNSPQNLDFVETSVPLFDLYRVESQFESAFKRVIYLKSGASLFIDETEAMTVIDVNTGKFTGGRDQEETIFKTNIDAADEIARQLRLRDLGGMILVDFIDMRDGMHKEKLLEFLKSKTASDSNRTTVHDMTALGIVELTRKKERVPARLIYTKDCPVCRGSGRLKSERETARELIRLLNRRRYGGDTGEYMFKVPESVATELKTMISEEEKRRTVIKIVKGFTCELEASIDDNDGD